MASTSAIFIRLAFNFRLQFASILSKIQYEFCRQVICSSDSWMSRLFLVPTLSFSSLSRRSTVAEPLLCAWMYILISDTQQPIPES